MPYSYHARYLSNYDGDTTVLDIDLGFDLHMIKAVRLNGVDTPEMKGFSKDKAMAAKVWLEKKMTGKKLVVNTCLVRDDGGLDKYGRVLGTIFVEGESTSVNDQLIAAGHAIAYDGGNKEKAKAAAEVAAAVGAAANSPQFAVSQTSIDPNQIALTEVKPAEPQQTMQARSRKPS